MPVWGVRLFYFLFMREEWWLNLGGLISMQQGNKLLTNKSTQIGNGVVVFKFAYYLKWMVI